MCIIILSQYIVVVNGEFAQGFEENFGNRSVVTKNFFEKLQDFCLDFVYIDEGYLSKRGDQVQDKEIVRLFLERNEKAVSAASEKYRAYCMKIAVNILNSQEDAEYCLNEVFLKAWELIPPHEPEMLSAFLGKITRNCAVNMYKHDTAQKRGGGEAALVYEELSEIVSGSSNVERDAENRELIAEINRFLKKQSAMKRSIFLCRYWYCDSVHDIAAEFMITENNVSTILNRTRKKLREYLQKRGFDI